MLEPFPSLEPMFVLFALLLPLLSPQEDSRRTLEQGVLCEGTVVMPPGEILPPDTQVWVLPLGTGLQRSDTSWRVPIAADGTFATRIPEPWQMANFRLDSNHFLGMASTWHRSSDSNQVTIRAQKRVVQEFRAKGPNGQTITQGTFYCLPQGNWDEPQRVMQLSSQADGKFLVPLTHFHSGTVLYGTTPEGWVMGPTLLMPNKNEPGKPLDLTFQAPARIRFTVKGKYPNAFGPLTISVAGKPAPQTRSEDGNYWIGSGAPTIRLQAKSLKPKSDDWPCGTEEVELWIAPGSEKVLRIESSDGWSGNRSLPVLLAGGLYEPGPIELDPGPVMRGRVVDAEGHGIEGARVRGLCGWNVGHGLMLSLEDPFDPTPYQSALQRAHRETVTDAQGRFLFRTPERMLTAPIEVSLPSTTPGQRAFQFHAKVPADGKEHTLPWMPGSAQWAGSVVSPEGEPIQRFEVQCRPIGWEAKLAYDDGLSREHQEVSWFEVHDSAPYRNMIVSLDSDAYILGPPYSPIARFSCESESGHFLLQHLVPGEFEWTVSVEGWPAQEWQTVTLPADQSPKFVLGPGGTLQLQAQKHDGSAWDSWKGRLDGPLQTHEGTRYVSINQTVPIQTNEQGELSLPGLTPGEYRLVPRHGLPFDKKTITVTSGETTQESLQAYGIGGIQGQVDWPDGPSGLHVELHGNEGQTRSYPRPKTPVREGQFIWPSLRAGSYTLHFTTPDSGREAGHILQPIEVTVRADSPTEVEVRPESSARHMTGTVRLNGELVTGGFLRLATPEFSIKTRRFSVTDEGRFDLWVAQPGSHEFQYLIKEGGSRSDSIVLGQCSVQVPEGGWQDRPLEFHQGKLELVLDGKAPLEADLARDLVLVRQGSATYMTVRRTLRPGYATQIFENLPIGSYALERKSWRSADPWTPVAGQLFEVTQHQVQQRATVHGENRHTVTVKAHWNHLPERTSFRVNAYSDAECTLLVSEAYLSPPRSRPLNLRGLTPGTIWIRVSAFSHPPAPRPKKSSILGPFRVEDFTRQPLELSLDWSEFRYRD